MPALAGACELVCVQPRTRSYGCHPPGQAPLSSSGRPDLKRPAQNRGNCNFLCGLLLVYAPASSCATCLAGSKPCSLALALWRDEPDLIRAEHLHGALANAEERSRGVRLPGRGVGVEGRGERVASWRRSPQAHPSSPG